jgi:hypothetical protein
VEKAVIHETIEELGQVGGVVVDETGDHLANMLPLSQPLLVVWLEMGGINGFLREIVGLLEGRHRSHQRVYVNEAEGYSRAIGGGGCAQHSRASRPLVSAAM